MNIIKKITSPTNTFGIQFIIRKDKFKNGVVPIYCRITVNGIISQFALKDSYWHALFDKLRKRMKAQKAIIVAVARRLLKVVYKTLETLTIYQEKGIAHFVDLQAKATLYHKSQLVWPQTDTD